ncbi:DUF4296 domain-containing protein [Tenacibaculum geojense]|uniref:DUF4296 domain-containing protein n=1 Tax=Tenacibaculum geojense TaxID=915352 RepID=UPI0036DAB307
MRGTSLIIFVFILLSCTSNTVYKKPEGLIPKDTMIALLTDMYIASAAKNTKNKFLQNRVNYMYLVHEKYGIDSTRFDMSNTYYTSKIEEYNDLIKEVKKRLEAKHEVYVKLVDSLDSIKRKNVVKPKKDTLRRKKLKKSLAIPKKIDETEELE